MPSAPKAIPRVSPLPARTGAGRTARKKTGIRDLLNDVHCRDCLELMRAMPAESVNMIFADPPFNLNKKYSSYKDKLPMEEYMAWTGEWLAAACRLLTPDGSIFVYNIPKLLVRTAPILDELAEFKHWIAWNANGRPLGKTLQPAHYGILFYTKGRAAKFYDVRAPHATCRACGEYAKDYGGKKHLRHPFGRQISDVWDDIHRVRHASKRVSSHPCQLPAHLIERMILMTTDEGDIVFDPFCGGGSAAVAARKMGRNYIGTEMDPGYCAAARAKLKETKPPKPTALSPPSISERLFPSAPPIWRRHDSGKNFSGESEKADADFFGFPRCRGFSAARGVKNCPAHHVVQGSERRAAAAGCAHRLSGRRARL